jgi:predicted ABC-type ATPase
VKPKAQPSLASLLKRANKAAGAKPLAFVLAGHNGSGKSTLWADRIAPQVQVPLVNADRLITSILPPPLPNGHLEPWAANLRDADDRWQKLAQDGVSAFMGLVMDRKMAFGFETVFSHIKELPDGTVETKIGIIERLKANGYFVVLVFVGLASVGLSIMRVSSRVEKGGHAVPLNRLQARYPRTQKVVGMAAPIADMTIMFDNSLTMDVGFSLARVQMNEALLFDCRDETYQVHPDVRSLASVWLDKVVGAISSGA